MLDRIYRIELTTDVNVSANNTIIPMTDDVLYQEREVAMPLILDHLAESLLLLEACQVQQLLIHAAARDLIVRCLSMVLLYS